MARRGIEREDEPTSPARPLARFTACIAFTWLKNASTSAALRAVGSWSLRSSSLAIALYIGSVGTEYIESVGTEAKLSQSARSTKRGPRSLGRDLFRRILEMIDNLRLRLARRCESARDEESCRLHVLQRRAGQCRPETHHRLTA